MLNKPSIIVTGASGFIGTNLLEYFLTKNYRVINLDINEPRNNHHYKYWKKIDICNFNQLSNIIHNFSPDYIVHLAARTDLRGTDILDYYKSNIEGVENLIKVISNNKNIKRVIFASSMLVNKVGYSTNNLFDYNPANNYGKSKVLGEKLIFDNHQKLPEFCIIRLTSIWGEWFREPYNDFFKRVLNRTFFLPGHKSCKKTIGYIGNTVFQINKLLFTNDNSFQGNIFYLGDQPPIKISEWSYQICKAAKISKPIRIPYIIFWLLAIVGDLLKLFKINFPMSKYRLNNMTTDQIFNLKSTYMICGVPPFNNNDGINNTLKWMNLFNNNN
jgi:GlcNAc-P-P-Und epimerase